MNMRTLQVLSTTETLARLPFPALIEALEVGFCSEINVPLRHHHSVSGGGDQSNSLLLMPAWRTEGFGGVKIVNVNPDNGGRNLPSVNSSYLLFLKETGEHLMLMDGSVLTQRRTAAASVLAAKFLARENSQHLLIIGAGKIAKSISLAYQAVFPIKQITIFNRNIKNAQSLANELKSESINVSVSEDLARSIQEADIISCATLSQDAILQGKYLQSGQHIDLIGSFTPSMREADDEVIRLSQILVDTEHALKESGDLSIPLETGVMKRADIKGTLSDLCRKKILGRRCKKDITLFKSVGSALEDLVAAELVYRSC